jgi:hypothetical protein
MKKITSLAIIILVLSGMPNLCAAEMSTPNFRITSDVIGSFGTKESSTSFELGDTGGEMGTGNSQSSSYSLSAGFWATVGDDDILIFNITDATADLGTLSSTQVRYDTAAFNAATNAQCGYAIQIYGSSLSSSSETITPLSSPAGPITGQEQFGFNLRQNSNPTVGNDPSGGQGQAYTDYNTPNAYKFSSGDIIAQSSLASYFTNYTMSFITDISNLSNAGFYSTNLTAVITGRF